MMAKKAKRKNGVAPRTSKTVVIIPPKCPHCGHQKFIKIGGLPETRCVATGKLVKRSHAKCKKCLKNYVLKEIFDI